MARPRLVECHVEGVRVDMPTGQHALVLRAKRGRRFVPIWIGAFEASAIAVRLAGTTTERPLSHDLAAELIRQLGGELELVAVNARVKEVFLARMVIRQGSRRFDLDCRPSDGAALALRLGARIFVATDLLLSEEKPAA